MDEREKDAKPPRVKSRNNLVSLDEEAATMKNQPESPGQRLLAAAANTNKPHNCLCSPTTHAGSFRCRLHRHASSAGMRRGSSVGSNLSELADKYTHQATLSSLSREA